MSAIRATYHTFKLVPSRSVAQIVLEIDIDKAEAALALLGIPQPGEPTWVGVAVLNDSAVAAHDRISAGGTEQLPDGATGRRAPHPLVQLGWQLCERTDYQKWICGIGQTSERYAYSKAAAEELTRLHCGVESRVEFKTDPAAAQQFSNLVGRFEDEMGYSTWKKPA